MKARFAIYHQSPSGEGEWLKVILKPGKVMEWGSGKRANEEGWSAWGWRIEHTGEGIVFNNWSDGVDCDGRLSNESSYYCTLENLRGVLAEDDRPTRPDWQHTDSRQRDYAAEAAGY